MKVKIWKCYKFNKGRKILKKTQKTTYVSENKIHNNKSSGLEIFWTSSFLASFFSSFFLYKSKIELNIAIVYPKQTENKNSFSGSEVENKICKTSFFGANFFKILRVSFYNSKTKKSTLFKKASMADSGV